MGALEEPVNAFVELAGTGFGQKLAKSALEGSLDSAHVVSKIARFGELFRGAPELRRGNRNVSWLRR